MSGSNKVVPDAMLSKEFLSQFKTEADVSKFLKRLHSQVLEKMLEGEMDVYLGYEKNSVAGNNSGNSRCRVFFNAHLELYNCLIHSILQSFIEGQKFVRGDR